MEEEKAPEQCPWTDKDGARCKWDKHTGNAHNILGLPGVPTEPTRIP
jgi:hypothetical protein